MEPVKPNDSSEPAPDGVPKEGDILAGKYRIDRVLGQGGMGVVVAAHHTTLRQKVAVKFLLPAAAQRGESTERFLREARAAVSIQSEHVARVTDVGTLDSGSPYMVMEFLTGSDLGQVLEERGPLPIDEAIDYLLQACEAIAEAHSLGLIHRDLKPANLFLTERADGSALVKVLDFGLSKATKPDALDASLTAAHVVMGSPYYMSPEQIRSFKGIDARTDIWSLGVILYQLLGGVRPFEAESLGALFLVIGGDPVPPLRDVRPDVPEALEAAILKCLEKDASKRMQSVAELAKALAPFGPETSRLSLDRILRVLADPSATSPKRDRISRTGPVPPVTAVAADASSEAAAARATSGSAVSGVSNPGTPPAAKTGPAEAPVIAVSSPVAVPVATSGPLPAPAAASPSTPAAKAGVVPVTSGSMSALAMSEPRIASPAAPPPGRRGVGVVLAAVVGVSAVASGLFFVLRGSGSGAAGAPTEQPIATQAAAPALPSAAPSAVTDTAPAPPADATDPLPSATNAAGAASTLFGRLPPKGSASATAQAASAAPTAKPAASASAAATATPAAPAPSSSASAAPVVSAAPTAAPVVSAAPTAPPAATPAPPPPAPPTPAPDKAP